MLENILNDAMGRYLAAYKDAPANWDGPDWWQLSPKEAEVFAIDPGQWPALVAVWQVFEFFSKRTDGWNDQDIEHDYPEVDAVVQAARPSSSPCPQS
ncbi:MAG: hypothetical protein QM740_17780 [Acidovorax sp.]